MKHFFPDDALYRRSHFRLAYILILLVFVPSFSSMLCNSLSLAADEETSKAVRRASPEFGRADVAHEVGIGGLYALVVGVSRYKNSKIPQLKVSDKDARDFAAFLKTQRKLFKNVHVDLLENEKATKQEIEKHLYYKLRRAGKDDTVVLFFSGHGADDPNTPGEFVFLSYDAEPEYLTVTAVQMSRQWFLQKLDSKRVLLIADACHAGGFSGQGVKSLAPSFQNVVQQFKESEGRVFLTSSRPDELSKEKPEAGNSIFTYYLLKGLKGEAADKDGVVTLKGLYDYVYSKTKDETNGFQRPQMEGRLVGLFPLALAAYHPGLSSPAAERDVTRRLEGGIPSLGGQYTDDAKSLLQSAQKGDVGAQAKLGGMYLRGQQVSMDFGEARNWLEKAASQGNQDAQSNLGDIYLKGIGVEVNREEGLNWLKKAAEQGNVDARVMLGLAYRSYYGGAQDVSESFKWLLKAAEQGNPEARSYIGEAYKDGRGVKKDQLEAQRWFKRSAEGYSQLAEQDDPKAQYQIGVMHLYGYGVEKDIHEALTWFQRASEQNIPGAFTMLRLLWLSGQLGRKDKDVARENFNKALGEYKKLAALGDANAMRNVGALYESLDSIPNISSFIGSDDLRDYEEAMKWFKKAADRGCPVAQRSVGKMYENGRGVQKDCGEAMKWYKRAAGANDIWVMRYIGGLYREGCGVPKDCEEAIRWYKKALEAGSRGALTEIGDTYRRCDTVKNLQEAINWYNKAGEAGLDEGYTSIGAMYSQEKELKNCNEGMKWYMKAAEGEDPDRLRAVGNAYQFCDGGKDCHEAIKWYKKAADKGGTSHIQTVGNAYVNCKEIKDCNKALEWYSKAVETGSLSALMEIASVYSKCEEVRNFDQAIASYKKAVELGEPQGLMSIAQLYRSEKGIKDCDKAVYWYEQAAAKGIDVSWPLAETYRSCEGVKDCKKAIEWYQKRIEKYPEQSFRAIANVYQSCDQVKDCKKAIEWYEKLAQKDPHNALGQIASIYRDCEQVRDCNKAIEAYLKIAEKTPALGYASIAQVYLSCKQVANINKAIEWYKKALAEGCSAVMLTLGELYAPPHDTEMVATGNSFQTWQWWTLTGKKTNCREALKWYLKAAEDKDSQSFALIPTRIGDLYRECPEIRDYREAAKWYKKAMEMDAKRDFGAAYQLGQMYLHGRGVPKDIAESERLLSIADKNRVFPKAGASKKDDKLAKPTNKK